MNDKDIKTLLLEEKASQNNWIKFYGLSPILDLSKEFDLIKIDNSCSKHSLQNLKYLIVRSGIPIKLRPLIWSILIDTSKINTYKSTLKVDYNDYFSQIIKKQVTKLATQTCFLPLASSFASNNPCTLFRIIHTSLFHSFENNSKEMFFPHSNITKLSAYMGIVFSSVFPVKTREQKACEMIVTMITNSGYYEKGVWDENFEYYFEDYIETEVKQLMESNRNENIQQVGTKPFDDTKIIDEKFNVNMLNNSFTKVDKSSNLIKISNVLNIPDEDNLSSKDILNLADDIYFKLSKSLNKKVDHGDQQCFSNVIYNNIYSNDANTKGTLKSFGFNNEEVSDVIDVANNYPYDFGNRIETNINGREVSKNTRLCSNLEDLIRKGNIKQKWVEVNLGNNDIDEIKKIILLDPNDIYEEGSEDVTNVFIKTHENFNNNRIINFNRNDIVIDEYGNKRTITRKYGDNDIQKQRKKLIEYTYIKDYSHNDKYFKNKNKDKSINNCIWIKSRSQESRYTCPTMQADIDVILRSLEIWEPELYMLLKHHSIDLSKVLYQWFSIYLAECIPNFNVLLRLWDLILVYGHHILLVFVVSLLQFKSESLKNIMNKLAPSKNVNKLIMRTLSQSLTLFDSAKKIDDLIFSPSPHTNSKNSVNDTDNNIVYDFDSFSNMCCTLLELREVYLQIRLLENGYFLPSTNQKCHSNNCKINIPEIRLGGNLNLVRDKILTKLRETILEVRHFFASLQWECSHHTHYNCLPDHDVLNVTSEKISQFKICELNKVIKIEQDKRSNNNWGRNKIFKVKKKKGFAIHAFEGKEKDELAFAKGDVISILNSKDDHCWLGEMNGVRGWFPSAYIKLIKESFKISCAAGDDSIHEMVAHLIRGPLCSSVQDIFKHGLISKSNFSFLSANPKNTWEVIQRVIQEISRDSKNNEFSNPKLNLCNAYNLDDNNKALLTPIQLLEQSLENIEATHYKFKSPPEIKFRSLICAGLNHKVLHHWFEEITKYQKVLEKWYDPYSFLVTPVRFHIINEFKLNLEWELPLNSPRNCLSQIFTNRAPSQITDKFIVKDTNSYQDNISRIQLSLKHNLFSYDL
ncbi:unnamed protein product [Gordionus sp. m RMFG-2023]